MLRIERILCPIDFSEISASTFDSAQSLARHYKAKLFLQHVVDFGLPYYEYYAPSTYLAEVLQTIRENAEKKLREFAKLHTSNGDEPECLVSDGWVTSAILSFADAQKVDLIVLGTHGVRGDDRGALGSVADKVLRKARCPVLVSRKHEHPIAAASGAQGLIQLQGLVFCTDFSDPSRRALEYALSVAAEYDAELTLLHVLEEAQHPDKIDQVLAAATGQLRELIPPGGGVGARIRTVARIGRAYEKIIEYATENHADLVIMAVRGRNALDLAVFGSTTYRVIQLGTCSVLAVHG